MPLPDSPAPSERLTRSPSRRRWRRALIAAAGGVVLLAGALYGLSPWLAARLAPRLAPALGLDSLQLQIGHPGLRGVRVGSLALASGRLRLSASDIRLGYRLGELLGGRLDEALVARLSVTVDEAAAGVELSESGMLPAPDPRALLDALPLRAATISRLELALPALGFAASGSARLDGQGFELALQASSPSEAERFVLAAELSRQGQVVLRLAEQDPGEPPFLDVVSELRDQQLTVTGRARLAGFVLDLVAALAALPAGEGAIAAAFSGSLPWPLPQPLPWSAVTARGEASLGWRPDGGDWSVESGTARWALADGELTAELDANVKLADLRLGLRAIAAPLLLADLSGAGSLALLPPGSAAAPFAAVDWSRRDAGLILQGSLSVREALLEFARRRFGLPEGEGQLLLDFQTRLPWPLPALEDLEPQADGTLRGAWRSPQLDLLMSDLDGRWRLDGRRLSGRLAGKLRRGALTADVGLSVVRLEQVGQAAASQGELSVGKLTPLSFSVRQALDGTSGSASLTGRLAVPGGGLAAAALQGWTQPLDLTAGSVDLNAELAWDEPAHPGGRVRIGLERVTARYDDYAVQALTADLDFRGQKSVWSLAPTDLTIDRVVTGVPVEAVSGGLAWSGDTVQVSGARARLLGGTAQIAPFDYAIETGVAGFTVELAGISLEQVLALEGEQVSGSGSLHGVLPVRLEKHRPSVAGGRIVADPPGGTIRVSPTLARGTGQPGLDFALRALQDFRYQILEADVDYARNGDLALAVHLQGRNPAVEGGRPIHYNLNVSENVPVLLESLRLESDLTRSIERRLNN